MKEIESEIRKLFLSSEILCWDDHSYVQKIAFPMLLEVADKQVLISDHIHLCFFVICLQNLVL